jgi:hypothetical protein
MVNIEFQRSNDVRVTLNLLSNAASALKNDGNDITVQFPENCFMETGAIALLTSWLLSQKLEGREIQLLGDPSLQGYLARMNIHRVLGLKEPDQNRFPSAGRFVPIFLIEDGADVFEAVNKIADIVLQQFDNAREFLPAFEWAVNEIVDNIFIHSRTKSPGVVCAQLFPNKKRLDIAICDSGIGIRESLGQSFPLKDDAEAISKALERGVTRDIEVGQGNGMAGSREIIKKNGGSFAVWSGSSLYRIDGSEDAKIIEGPSVPGTGVLLSFDLNEPVLLRDTWIGERGWSYIEAEAERIAEQGIVVKDVCSHTGSRPPATRLRRKILALLPEIDGAIKVNFSGVTSLSSSFLDELLGRMNAELGNDRFNERVIVTGLSELHKNMANNVIGQRLAIGSDTSTAANAWMAIEKEFEEYEFPFPEYVLELDGGPILFSGIRADDWILIVNTDGEITKIGKILRLRSSDDKTVIYFENLLLVSEKVSVADLGSSIPESGKISRIQMSTLKDAVSKTASESLDRITRIDNPAYIRELLQLAVMDDLLGPAAGPEEQIVDMSVRDRYLVGKLAPREAQTGSIEGLEGPLAVEADEDEPGDLDVHTGRHDPGVEFDGAAGRVDAEADSSDEIDAASNQSLVPSSFGMTFCVAGDVDAIKVEARWGRYERDYETEIYKTRRNKETGEEEQGAKAKIWQRISCSGTIRLELKEGQVAHQAPDLGQPEVRVQGTIRDKNAEGDRLVTLFLVNAQQEPDENKDSAWIFQPELIVRASDTAAYKAVFRRRLAINTNADDPEREALEMIYRKQVEFASGHGVAIHAETNIGETERAMVVRTVVMPQSEVPVTETPGLRPEDRPAMREMIDKGFLDMEELAAMDRPDLINALSNLTNDYDSWIKEQHGRIGTEVVGFDEHANGALENCKQIHMRLVEGINVLADEKNDMALEAFRFANRVMAKQRIHSMYALARRRGENVEVADLEQRKNRSWRPFQLAFVLLSLPSLADPTHTDRAKPVEALADLLWFPTGGGKTEAYLGVAAFAMAIRRMQGELGGYDGSRGLTVIMRYTLRLLTLQQFQRATTLICAMELERQEALASGSGTFGTEPFTIGLWVGNKVTPGTTEDSHRAIQRIRDPDKFDAGGASPAQLTNCPWCGSEVSDKRDIEVDKNSLRTKIYCGDKKARCEFSKGRSSKNFHPGLPVLVVDEEIYHRPPTMMIATVDKFAMMAWRGDTRTMFGRATSECPRHGLLWPEDNCCTGNHPARGGLSSTKVKKISPIRPPDLIIQDEFHLISGPLGTMVGLYETAVDELSTWRLGDEYIKPKIIASTATVRKAKEQVNGVFMRRVAVFPPSGLDVADNFFSVQRPIDQIPGRRYLGVCSPGSSRPAMLIRIYTAFLTAAQALFDRFGQAADPYLTTVGYFNSLRELGGMKRLAEDDVQTRCYRVQMSLVERPGLAQRSVNIVRELTSRVSSRDIPKYLDELEIKFNAAFDSEQGKFIIRREEGEARSTDVVLATNMLSVGVDINRLGLMVVNGQPKGTAEYIQATSRVGRAFPGLVCTVLTWARPRDLSHYETFEHYHETFYKHVEAQSVTPFSPRAMDRGLTGAMLSMVRLESDQFNPNKGAAALDKTDKDEVVHASDLLVGRAWGITELSEVKDLAFSELKERVDEWAKEAGKGGRTLAYEKKGKQKDTMVALLNRPGIQAWDNFTVPMSMREVEPGVRLVMNTARFGGKGPAWTPPPTNTDGVEDGS